MASHRSTQTAPADDQASAESFDETKAGAPAEQRRPDRDKADEGATPLDQALDGAVGERFGEQVDAPDAITTETTEDETVSGPAPEGVHPPDDIEDPEAGGRAQTPEERLDEAMDETFPASDPPPIRPGEG